MNLLPMEIHKLLFSPLVLLLILLLFTGRTYTLYAKYQTTPSFTEVVYKTYTEKLYGPLNDEKEDYLRAERRRINGILTMYDEMQEAFSAGAVSTEEYEGYLREYQDTYVINGVFTEVEKTAREIRDAREMGLERWFLYDTGWNLLLSDGGDWLLLLFLLFLFCEGFAIEYRRNEARGSFAMILRTTKNGRKETFRAKFSAALLLSGGFWILFAVIEPIVYLQFYGLEELAAPLRSLEAFSLLRSGLTLGDALLLFLFLRCLGFLFAVFFCLSLSALLKKGISALLASLVILSFPYLLSVLGLRCFSYIDATALLEGGALLKLFAGRPGELIIALLYYAAAALGVTLLVCIAHRRFVR